MLINNLGGEALRQFAKNTPGIYADLLKAFHWEGNDGTMGKTWAQTVTANSVKPISPYDGYGCNDGSSESEVGCDQKLNKGAFIPDRRQKAKLQGDLNMLTDILDKYKFNWDNVNIETIIT